MAFGSIITQPGYRAPTQSMKPRGGGYVPPPRQYTAPTRSGGGFGGGPVMPGRGFPTRQPAATPYQQPGQQVGQQVSGAQSNFNMPPPQQFTSAAYQDPNLGYMANFAKGLMDPESDYYKRLSQGMQQQIGAQSAAQQRAAALRGAWGGLGGGQGGEVMATAADIGQAGLEAQGQAEAGLRLQAPQLGMQGMQSTFAPQLGYNQLTEGSRQWAGGMGEQARQFGVGVGLQQQGMAAQAAQFQAQQQAQAAAQQQQASQFQQGMDYNYWKAMQDQMAQNYMA